MKLLSDLGDLVTDVTDLVAIRVPLSRAAEPGEVTLDLPGYAQTNSYCCGAVAGVMALKHFKPNASFTRFCERANPDPKHGTSTARLIRALRQSGLRVSERHGLTFACLCAAIDAGNPIIVVVQNPKAKDDHWVVIYGYGKRPQCVFLATNGTPLFTSNRVPLRNFKKLWSPHGNGLICAESKRKSHRKPASKLLPRQAARTKSHAKKK